MDPTPGSAGGRQQGGEQAAGHWTHQRAQHWTQPSVSLWKVSMLQWRTWDFLRLNRSHPLVCFICFRTEQRLHTAADMFLEVVLKRHFPEFITSYLNLDHTFLTSQNLREEEKEEAVEIGRQRAKLWGAARSRVMENQQKPTDLKVMQLILCNAILQRNVPIDFPY